MAKKRKSSRALQRARRAVELQYGPQEQEAKRAIGEVEGQRVHEIRASKATGKQLAANAVAGGKRVSAEFSRVGEGAAQNQAFVDSVLSPAQATGGPGSALAAAIARERQAQPTKREFERANAVAEQENRGARAEAGAQYARLNANRQAGAAAEKLRSQLQGILRSKGLSLVNTYEDFTDQEDEMNLGWAKYQEDVAHNRATEASAAERNAISRGKNKTKLSDTARSAKVQVERGVGNARKAGGVVIGSKLVNGKDEPIVWKLANAKRGILANGRTTDRRSAVRQFESRLVSGLAIEYGDVLAKAIAQTYVWGGVGPNTGKSVKRQYDGLRLKKFSKR